MNAKGHAKRGGEGGPTRLPVWWKWVCLWLGSLHFTPPPLTCVGSLLNTHRPDHYHPQAICFLPPLIFTAGRENRGGKNGGFNDCKMLGFWGCFRAGEVFGDSLFVCLCIWEFMFFFPLVSLVLFRCFLVLLPCILLSSYLRVYLLDFYLFICAIILTSCSVLLIVKINLIHICYSHQRAAPAGRWWLSGA